MFKSWLMPLVFSLIFSLFSFSGWAVQESGEEDTDFVISARNHAKRQQMAEDEENSYVEQEIYRKFRPISMASDGSDGIGTLHAVGRSSNNADVLGENWRDRALAQEYLDVIQKIDQMGHPRWGDVWQILVQSPRLGPAARPYHIMEFFVDRLDANISANVLKNDQELLKSKFKAYAFANLKNRVAEFKALNKAKALAGLEDFYKEVKFILVITRSPLTRMEIDQLVMVEDLIRGREVAQDLAQLNLRRIRFVQRLAFLFGHDPRQLSMSKLSLGTWYTAQDVGVNYRQSPLLEEQTALELEFMAKDVDVAALLKVSQKRAAKKAAAKSKKSAGKKGLTGPKDCAGKLKSK
ncbi:MAG: hypothetical protein J6Y94_05015 [Bacteriovoracaceae bacterium]|nr:hypothetical protein [Bacteriovoracaceae bacterium]